MKKKLYSWLVLLDCYLGRFCALCPWIPYQVWDITSGEEPIALINFVIIIPSIAPMQGEVGNALDCHIGRLCVLCLWSSFDMHGWHCIPWALLWVTASYSPFLLINFFLQPISLHFSDWLWMFIVNVTWDCIQYFFVFQSPHLSQSHLDAVTDIVGMLPPMPPLCLHQN